MQCITISIEFIVIWKVHTYDVFFKRQEFSAKSALEKYDKDDVPLTKGKAYYADEDEYEEYLKSRAGTEADTEVGLSQN